MRRNDPRKPLALLFLGLGLASLNPLEAMAATQDTESKAEVTVLYDAFGKTPP